MLTIGDAGGRAERSRAPYRRCQDVLPETREHAYEHHGDHPLSGAVIRRASRPSDNFAQISNATLADERLSWKAVGLLAYLLSRPIGWGTTAQDLWKSRTHRGEGRDVIYAALKELERYGYLRRARVRMDDGT